MISNIENYKSFVQKILALRIDHMFSKEEGRVSMFGLIDWFKVNIILLKKKSASYLVMF